MPANPRMPVLTVGAACGGAGGGDCGGTAAMAAAGGVAASADSAVTGSACQTWVHFEQRTLRPSGGNTAAVS